MCLLHMSVFEQIHDPAVFGGSNSSYAADFGKDHVTFITSLRTGVCVVLSKNTVSKNRSNKKNI